MKRKIISFLVITVLIVTTTMSALGRPEPKELMDNNINWETPEINKSSPTNYNFNLFYWLFIRFPNVFPIFKYLLVVSGFMDRFVKEGTGKLVMQLTDAPGLNITEALVNISQVKVHYAGEYQNDTNGTWIIVSNDTQTFDLIQLQNATEVLGEVNLTAGWYTQIRMLVDKALVTIDGIQYNLEIPSKNVKLITPFLVQDNETLTLTLDFDVQKSVHKTGSSKYIMKPTIKVVQVNGDDEFKADAGGDYQGEVNETIQFYGSAEGGVEPYTWYWDFGDGYNSTEQNPQHAYMAEGEYEVTLTVTDAENNTATDEAEAEIEDEEEEGFEADAGGDYQGEVNETIQFYGSAEGGVEPYTWYWDFGDGYNSTEQNPQHAYMAEGEYEVTLTVTDAENNTATDEAEVEIGED